jgi:hypothetical protein
MLRLGKSQSNSFRRDAWLEVNLSNLEFNINTLHEEFNKPLIPVIKADAYGHGANVLAELMDSYDFIIIILIVIVIFIILYYYVNIYKKYSKVNYDKYKKINNDDPDNCNDEDDTIPNLIKNILKQQKEWESNNLV